LGRTRLIRKIYDGVEHSILLLDAAAVVLCRAHEITEAGRDVIGNQQSAAASTIRAVWTPAD
jgi:hypothetical protein